MKVIFVICFLLFSKIFFAQFAIISDKDGYCNIRSSADKGNKIVDKLANGHLVYCFEKKGNWINIDYKKNDKELNGDIYYDRVKFISDYNKISQLSEEKDKIIFGEDSIRIIISQQKFDKSKYKLTYYKDNKDYIELINNKKYWGTDGELPKSGYKSIEIYFGKKKLFLPKAAIENLFEPSLFNTQVNYDGKNDILYIQSMNSDGAGSYEVIWKIEKGIYKERFIAYGF